MHLRLSLAMAAAAALITLAACTSAGSPGPSPSAGAQGAAGGVTVGASANAGGGGGGGAAAVTDPCTLLTQAEVSAAIGQPVGPGSTADNPNECAFPFPPQGESLMAAGVGFIDGSLDDYCKDTGSGAVGLTIEPVSGLGDGGCFIHVGSLKVGSSVTFAKDGRLFDAFALLGSDASIDDVKSADTKLAQDALNHL